MKSVVIGDGVKRELYRPKRLTTTINTTATREVMQQQEIMVEKQSEGERERAKMTRGKEP